MKAVLQYRATPGFREQIAKLESDWLQIVVIDETDKPAFAREMHDAHVLLHVLERVTAAGIDASPQLRLIQKLGVGVDTIDLEAARRRGIAVCNMPGANTRAVAELTLLLMLASLRRLAEIDTRTRQGDGWRLDASSLDGLGELGGREVGLVGFGAVGKCLAPMLEGIGARVTHTKALPFDQLLARADIVSLHIPLNDKTTRIMNAEAFAKMKRGSILINTARGGLVDEPALLSALASGQLRGAGLDVFATEPVNPDNPLLKLPNVLVTPHLAWFTRETLARGLTVFAENCRRLRDGEPFVNRVV